MKHEEFLTSIFSQGKLSHAYLLTGNDAEKKKKTLQAFIQTLVGKEVKDFLHPDIIVIKKEEGFSEIRISQIRALKENMSQGAWSLPVKIAILEDADQMNIEAQSAFLKLLEEPRGSRVFFLLCQHRAELLDTVTSRTQELRFFTYVKEKQEGFEEFLQSSLFSKFESAKEAVETQGDTQKILKMCMIGARQKLFSSQGREQKKWGTFLQEILKTKQVLKETNANVRVQLECLFCNL